MAPMQTPLKQLYQDCLIAARDEGYDVFNSLDVLQNEQVFKELKFEPGDGNLHFYLYNWRLQDVSPDKIGLVLV